MSDTEVTIRRFYTVGDGHPHWLIEVDDHRLWLTDDQMAVLVDYFYKARGAGEI